jgi:uncharacterized membrane protein
MSSDYHIRNPFEVGLEQAAAAASAVGHAIADHRVAAAEPAPVVRQITIADLRDALGKGMADLGAYRSDILFIGLVYPLAGILLAQAAYGHSLLPLIFPLASGFALIGPLAAIGLYEISLRREQGAAVTWADAAGVLRSPSFPSIVGLGLVMVALFLAWLGAAYGIYWLTLGPQPPASLGAFVRDVFETPAGWAMIVAGLGVGFLFAVVSLAISVVSFPLLLEHNVGVGRAIATSIRAVRANPRTMAVWGLIVAGGLVLGSLPAFAGLVVVMPVLGHATWRLYRKVVAA